MNTKIIIVYCLLTVAIAGIQASFFRDMWKRIYRTDNENEQNKALAEIKEPCDENQLLLHLAHLHLTSPERIVMLITSRSLKKSCNRVADAISRINETLSNCAPLPSSNLYMKLFDAVKYFEKSACGNQKTKKNHITDYQDCIQELRNDIVDCEGPPIWFANKNKTSVCKYFNMIGKCHYFKAALLCGLKSATQLCDFSMKIMARVLPFKCRVSTVLPHVDFPMPSRSAYRISPAYIIVLLVHYIRIL